VIISLVALPVSGAAELSGTRNPLQQFSTCVGQLSAQMEFEWLFNGPASEVTEMRRAAMLELVQAVMGEADGPKVLNWRITAKQAQAALLTRATFNEDPEDAAWAMQMAEDQAAFCTGLLLS